MSQYPHDEFDDVPSYRPDEIGKHREAGAVGRSKAAAGSLPWTWIGLAAAAVAVIVIFAYVILPLFAGEEEPTAEDDTDTQTTEEEQDPDGDPEDNGEEGTEEDNGEDDTPAETEDLPEVRGVNAGAPTGSANHLHDTLAEAGFNVGEEPINWDFGAWGEISTPVVMYPSAEEEEHAQEIAAELGIDSVVENGNWSTIVVVVGPEYDLPADYEVGG
ncbi:LytR C-terminal domain-containing protein [Nesterenkonia alba]|uniref:LytR C-terminal domain-containing protein n=1 Tax=Nesterenkonia alba TaxID=515814 RepID=UPI0003B7374A|nr:LytR C-terminal domain-containing protein [Nesterenkonia alba]